MNKNCHKFDNFRIVALSFVLIAIIGIWHNTFAGNWSWDQNHDCTTLYGVHGRYDYSGAFVPDPCCPCTKCNIYSLTGVYFESATDITLTGIGPTVSLSRTWNSNDPASGLVGKGWTFSLGRSVVPVKGNDGQEYLIVKRTNGQEIKMLRQGDHYIFTTDMQFGFTIEKITAGWRLVERDGMVNEYNNDGKLVRITDRNDKSATIQYNSAGCLAGATNANGQSLAFTLNPNGKLASVIDNYGRAVTYHYDNDNLTKVDYWDSSSVQYTYGSEDLLVAVSNRRGHTIREIVYNQEGRVIEIKEKGETAQLSYDKDTKTTTKTDGKSRIWTITTDENGINILEVDPLGHQIRRKPNNIAGPSNFEWTEDRNNNRTYFTYNGAGDMTSKTDPCRNTEYWVYNENHQITNYTDASGVVTEYVYNYEGNMTKKIEAKGTPDQQEWVYTYDRNGNMESETNPNHATTYFEYDTLGNKTKQIGPTGDTTTWVYDSLSRVKSMTDPMKNTWTYKYDNRGNQISEKDPLDNIITREYDFDNNLTAETDALGNRTTYTYDPWNRLIMRIGPLQDTTIQQWATIGDESYLSGIRDAIGHWTYYEYDDGGRKIAEITKMGDTSSTPDDNDLVTKYAYDAAGNILKTTNPEGDTTGFTYDENNRRKKQCNGMNECTQTEYDPNGRVETITQPNDNVITYTYNALGLVTKISDIIGIINEKKYDPAGNVTWDRTPGRGAMMYQYDQSNRVIHQMDSSGVGSRFVYDKVGHVVASTDSLHNTTQRGYDALGRMIWTRNALGDTVKNQHDANGNQTALIDPDGNTTTFSFDAAGRTIATKYPDDGVDSTTYDKLGRVKTKKDPRQIITTFTYDDAGRLLRKTYSDGKTPEDTYTYDKNGRMITANNSVAQLTWKYDEASRPIRYEQVVDGATDVLLYGYDVFNGISSLTYPDGKVVQRKMDLRNRLDSVVVDNNLIAADYDYIGMAISKKKLGNGIVASYSYDKSGRLTRLAYTGGIDTLPDFSYGYDFAGNMRYALKNHQTDMSETYEYDAISQLVRWRRGILSLSDTTVHSPNYYQEWVLDKRGNWRRFDDNGRVENRVHNEVNELLSIDNKLLTYDDNGNLNNDENRNYISNAKNFLISAGKNEYLYDAIGRRIQKIDENGNSYISVYDQLHKIKERVKGGTVIDYIYSNEIDDALCLFENQQVYYYIKNLQQSVIQITELFGKPIESYKYLPYGKMEISDSTNEQISKSLINNDITYTGREFDYLTRDYYYRNRYFYPIYGRFGSRDPKKFIDGSNLYCFVNNSPVLNKDPLGLFIERSHIGTRYFYTCNCGWLDESHYRGYSRYYRIILNSMRANRQGSVVLQSYIPATWGGVVNRTYTWDLSQANIDYYSEAMKLLYRVAVQEETDQSGAGLGLLGGWTSFAYEDIASDMFGGLIGKLMAENNYPYTRALADAKNGCVFVNTDDAIKVFDKNENKLRNNTHRGVNQDEMDCDPCKRMTYSPYSEWNIIKQIAP